MRFFLRVGGFAVYLSAISRNCPIREGNTEGAREKQRVVAYGMSLTGEGEALDRSVASPLQCWGRQGTWHTQVDLCGACECSLRVSVARKPVIG